jgi:hypothetical protein
MTPPPVDPPMVTAHPILATRIARIAAVAVVVVFIVVALVMKHDNAGVTFVGDDQIGTVVLGLLIASGFLLLTRPRLIADVDSVRARSFVGDYRTIPWNVVVAVEFPSTVRFARLVLPGEETLCLYAVQRLDKQHSVIVMRGLRSLLAQSRTTKG